MARARTPAAAAMPRFYRSLAVMFGAGIPLHRSLDQLGANSEDPVLAEVCEKLTRDLESGRSFASSLRRYPEVFDTFVVRMMQVAESSGKLYAVMRSLADQEEWSLRNRMKLKSALVYPAFSLTLCLTMVLLGPSFLLRGQLELLRSSGVELPLLTQVLILISDGLRSVPVVSVGVLVAGFAVVGFRRWLGTTSGLLRFYQILDCIPVVARILWVSAIARFARSMSLLLDAGVSLTSALSMATAASGNPWFEQKTKLANEHIMSGDTMMEAMKRTEAFDGLFYAALEAGERSGSMSKSMAWVAKMGDEELETALERLVSVVEPALMLFTGLCVGLLLVATMMPTVKLLETL